MNAPIELPRPLAALRRPQPQPVNPRSAALAEFDRRVENLRQCVHWLVEHGVSVTDSRLGRAGGIVKAAGSPGLRALVGQDCTWRQRRQQGALTIFTWFAIRFETRIEWEETCA